MSELRLNLDDGALRDLAEALRPFLSARDGPEPWVGVPEAAAHLDCKPQRIYNLVHDHAIPHRKDGSRLLFRLSDLDAWLSE